MRGYHGQCCSPASSLRPVVWNIVALVPLAGRGNFTMTGRDPMANFDKPPTRVLVFGAAGHIGGPLAHWIATHHSDVSLRLATSRPASVAELRSAFPDCEVVVCSYYQPEQLAQGVALIAGTERAAAL